MHKCLYLLCPTDCLESIINKTFQYENYFYSSLGNSLVFDIETLGCLKGLIEKHQIKEIHFVLSHDNQIVLDALGNRYFSKIMALNNVYAEIEKQNKRSKARAHSENRQFSIISHYLSKKVKVLQLELNNLLYDPVKVRGKIYHSYQNTFTDVCSGLVGLEKHHLN